MARIKVIEHHEAEGALKEIYDDLVIKRGKLAEVHKIQSLHPASIVHHMDLYMSIMYHRSPLTRAQREMMAVVVSAANHCAYCQVHHKQALHNYWKDELRVDGLAVDYTRINLNKTDLTLCDLAYTLTTNPADPKIETLTQELKKLGLEDRAVLDANLVIAYFNFVNRMVLGLGVSIEEDHGSGYKY